MEFEKYLIMGMGVHTVASHSSVLFHFDIHRNVVPTRLFIPEHVAIDFLVYKISTAKVDEDDVKQEDHVLLADCDPVPATLFSSTVELTEEILRQFRPKAEVKNYLPQYPWPLRMCPVKKGDQLQLGVTNMNVMPRYFMGAFLVVPQDEK
jgi:hypothetical protein